MIGQGDYFQMQVNYSQGALRYIFQTPNTNWGINDGQSAGWGVVSDGVYGGTVATRNRHKSGTDHGLERQRGL